MECRSSARISCGWGCSRGNRAAQILVPGAGMSIYGRHLGPDVSCARSADPKQRETPNPRASAPAFLDLAVYPKELCDVQILIGGAWPDSFTYQRNRSISRFLRIERARSFTPERGRGITHSPTCDLNHRLAEAAIGCFKTGWLGNRRPGRVRVALRAMLDGID